MKYQKSENSLPDEVDANVYYGAVSAPIVNEFVSNPATWVDGSELASKCNAGCTRLEAAACLAIYRRST